jgi:hypothetical protein
MRRTCSRCGKPARHIKHGRYGGRWVRSRPDHDLCEKCFRAELNHHQSRYRWKAPKRRRRSADGYSPRPAAGDRDCGT